MKSIKTILIGGAIATLSACASNSNRYTITIDAPDSVDDNATVYLVDFDTKETTDSAVVKDGKVVFTGNVEKPYMAYIVSNGNRLGSIIVEPGEIVDHQDSTEGGRLNSALGEFFANYSELGERFQSAADEAKQMEILMEYETYCDSVMRANADNVLGYYIFLQKAYEMDADSVEKALEEYPAFADYQRIKDLRETFARQAATAPGKQYTDFEVEYNGTVQRLSDYVGDGKYLLVDFWASWCGPCRREIPVIKDLYVQYKDKGMEVLGVAVWDEPDNSLAAIEQLKMPWPQIINAQTVPTDLYGINGIPCIMMISPDGEILFRGLQGADLRAAVANIFNE